MRPQDGTVPAPLHRLALATALCLLLLAALQAYWGLGGGFGLAYVLPPTGDALPPTQAPQVYLCLAFLLTLTAHAVLHRGGLMAGWFPEWFYGSATRVAAAVLGLRAVGDFRAVGWFKTIHQGAFATLDTYLYAPLSFGLAAAVLHIGTRGRLMTERTQTTRSDDHGAT